jgi:hypothetical protein
MSYEYLSDSELIHEIDVLEKLTEALASQAEKLARLRAEGKVGDSVYREVFEDLRRKAEVTNRKKDELIAAAESRLKQMDGESSQLRHQIEMLDVRHAIGAMADDRYKVAHEGFLTQLAELDEIKKRISELVNAIGEASRRITQYVPSTVVGRLQEGAPITSPIAAQPAMKPMERPTVSPSTPPILPPTTPTISTPTVSTPATTTILPPTIPTVSTLPAQPKAEARQVEVKTEGSKPKVKKCAKCGAENLESASYCYNCGAKL